jgi:hypothetical protein
MHRYVQSDLSDIHTLAFMFGLEKERDASICLAYIRWLSGEKTPHLEYAETCTMKNWQMPETCTIKIDYMKE